MRTCACGHYACVQLAYILSQKAQYIYLSPLKPANRSCMLYHTRKKRKMPRMGLIHGKNCILPRHCGELVIVHFTVLCLVTWPVNKCEAGIDLV